MELNLKVYFHVKKKIHHFPSFICIKALEEKGKNPHHFCAFSESGSVMSESSQPHGLYSPRNSLGQNTGIGTLSLLQEIILTQGLNPGLLHCRRILYQLSHNGSPFSSAWHDYSHFNKNQTFPQHRKVYFSYYDKITKQALQKGKINF